MAWKESEGDTLFCHFCSYEPCFQVATAFTGRAFLVDWHVQGPRGNGPSSCIVLPAKILPQRSCCGCDHFTIISASQRGCNQDRPNARFTHLPGLLSLVQALKMARSWGPWRETLLSGLLPERLGFKSMSRL